MDITRLFLQVIAIVALGRLIGLLIARLRQPQVIGEMLAGILLGPSLLGWMAPSVYAYLFPPATMPLLNALSQVGVVFFLFLVGLELDLKLMRSQGRAAATISAASIAVPFALGVGLAVFFRHRPLAAVPSIKFTASVLFMGVAMSITAFPVLARILAERNLQRTPMGAMAISCAAVAELAAWCMLAVVTAFDAIDNTPKALWTVFFSVLYVTTMFVVVRPFLRRLEVVYDRQGRLAQAIVSIILLLLLASSYTTASIGIHALFGAFLMGYVMPKGSQFVRHLSEKIEDYTVVFLLPLFFASAGLQTQFGLLNSGSMWACAVLIVVVATVGKFGGTAIIARATGLAWRESAAIGILMNTRGLMELVILTAGLDLKLITPALYTLMVLMTLLTTAATTPLLNIIYPRRLFRRADTRTDVEADDPTDSSPVPVPPSMSILIPVSLPKSGAPLVQLADMLFGGDTDRSRVLAVHLRKPADHDVYRSGLDEAAQSHDPSLAPLLAQARGRSIPVEQLSFVSRDVAGDIASVARQNRVDLVLMGFHKPVIGKQILGGTVHRVLQQCEADVAIFVDRGFRTARRILVPYLGANHDRLALQLAARMARNVDVQVTVLHVIPPLRRGGRGIGAKDAVDRVFAEPGHPTPVTFRVIEDESPVGVLLHQAQNADLVVIGVAEEWGLESHLFGWRAQRIARDCPSSLLIVRKAKP